MSIAPLRGGQARYDEIMGATIDVLRETGYERLTVDAVVARARASKATVYRRWPSKSALVVAAFEHATRHLPTHPDTGTLRGDLLVVFLGMVDELERFGDLVTGLMTQMRHNPDLAAAMRERFVAKRRQVLAEAFDQAEARDELRPDAALDMLWQVVPAIILFRTMLGEPVDHAFVTRTVDELVLPLCLSSGESG